MHSQKKKKKEKEKSCQSAGLTNYKRLGINNLS